MEEEVEVLVLFLQERSQQRIVEDLVEILAVGTHRGADRGGGQIILRIDREEVGVFLRY